MIYLFKMLTDDQRIANLLDCIRILKIISFLKYPIDSILRKNLKFLGIQVFQMYTLNTNFKLLQVLQLFI